MIRYLYCDDSKHLPAAAVFAADYSLTLVESLTTLPDNTHCVWLNANGIGLGEVKRSKLQSSFQVDFIAGRLGHRRRFGNNAGSDLLRAIGSSQVTVLDATAGFAGDSVILAAEGCTVTMCERNALVRALVQDAIRRASASDDLAIQPVIMRLHCMAIDAHQFLQELSDTRLAHKRPGVIYLDPMYPERKKSALVKKEMRWIRELVGDDPDAGQLLPAARAVAQQRVVVKRMRTAEFLDNQEPDHSISGKTVRFDVYTTAHTT
jgi:16S rRNA (guanine1516-N2)-methyltransferase